MALKTLFTLFSGLSFFAYYCYEKGVVVNAFYEEGTYYCVENFQRCFKLDFFLLSFLKFYFSIVE